MKTLDPDWNRVRIQPKMLDPDPYQMNTWSTTLVPAPRKKELDK